MLNRLKKSIEAKKRQRDHAKEEDLKRMKSTREEEADDPDFELIERTLKAKAEKYNKLLHGESNVIPKGSLVDFESKLNRPLITEEELSLKDDDDMVSRSLNVVPPPPAYARPKISSIVDSILIDVAFKEKLEDNEEE